MNEEERELAERGSRQLRLAKGALAAGFVGASAMVLAGGHPAVGIAVFVGCAAAAVGMAKKARAALTRARRHQEMREALDALGMSLEQEPADEYCGEAQELREQAGIELFQPGGFLGGKPVYVFALKEGRVYEYDGLASERSLEQEGLVINTLLYLPASEERSAVALASRRG